MNEVEVGVEFVGGLIQPIPSIELRTNRKNNFAVRFFLGKLTSGKLQAKSAPSHHKGFLILALFVIDQLKIFTKSEVQTLEKYKYVSFVFVRPNQNYRDFIIRLRWKVWEVRPDFVEKKT